MQKNNYLVKDFEVTSSEVDAHSVITPKHILEILQDLATEHAEILGFGWKDLNKMNLVWVLSKVSVEILRPVARTEKIKAYTWPVAPDRFFAEREFVLTVDGKTAIRATSKWCLLDMTTRGITNPTVINGLYGGSYLTERSGAHRNVEKISAAPDYLKVYDKVVRWTDLDLNMHVNNTNYVSYAMDAVPFSMLSEKVKQFEVTFTAECHAGDVIEIFCKRDGEVCRIAGQKDGKTCFTAKITF